MMKWFEEVNLTRPAVICSRVRLVRNLGGVCLSIQTE